MDSLQNSTKNSLQLTERQKPLWLVGQVNNSNSNEFALAIRSNQTKLTLEKAIEAGTQISKLKREQPLILLKSIIVLVQDVCTFFAAKNTLKPEHVESCATLIADTYPLMKLEEIAYALKLAKQGKTEKVYGSIDQSVILSWVEQYYNSEDRAIHFEQRAKKVQQEQQAQNTEVKKVIDYNAYLERMKAEAAKPKAKEQTSVMSAYLVQKQRREVEALKHLHTGYTAETVDWFIDLHVQAKMPKLNKDDMKLYREMENAYRSKWNSIA
jgi:hypothetical protein